VPPPIAKRVPVERTRHGDTVVDEYAWLRDRDDPDTLAYLEAENAWTEQQLAHTVPLQERLFEEIKRRPLYVVDHTMGFGEPEEPA